MKTKRLTHNVWMGFPNYKGDINSIEFVAAFCSKTWAMDFISSELGDDGVVYGYYESGDDFPTIVFEDDGKIKESCPLKFSEAYDGEVYIEGGMISAGLDSKF